MLINKINIKKIECVVLPACGTIIEVFFMTGKKEENTWIKKWQCFTG